MFTKAFTDVLVLSTLIHPDSSKTTSIQWNIWNCNYVFLDCTVRLLVRTNVVCSVRKSYRLARRIRKQTLIRTNFHALHFFRSGGFVSSLVTCFFFFSLGNGYNCFPRYESSSYRYRNEIRYRFCFLIVPCHYVAWEQALCWGLGRFILPAPNPLTARFARSPAHRLHPSLEPEINLSCARSLRDTIREIARRRG